MHKNNIFQSVENNFKIKLLKNQVIVGILTGIMCLYKVPQDFGVYYRSGAD